MITVKGYERNISYKPGIIVCGAALSLLLLYQLLIDKKWLSVQIKNSSCSFDFNINLLSFGVSIICFVFLIAAAVAKKNPDAVKKLYIFSYVGVYLCFGVTTFSNLNTTSIYDNNVVIRRFEFNTAVPSRITESDRIKIPVSPVSKRNYNQIWKMNSVDYFCSLNDRSYIDFLSDLGIVYGKTKNVEIMDKRLLDLLSVRYLIEESGEFDGAENLSAVDKFGSFTVLENTNYIPIGFTYDLMISEEKYLAIENTDEKTAALMKYLVAENPGSFSDILEFCDTGYTPVTDDEYTKASERHRRECSETVTLSTEGLVSQITLSRENIVMFSVPYGEGWSAYVNGEDSEILRVNDGLIGVRAQAGKNEIKLVYKTPGETEGIIITAAAAIVFAGYMIITGKRKGLRGKKNKGTVD